MTNRTAATTDFAGQVRLRPQGVDRKIAPAITGRPRSGAYGVARNRDLRVRASIAGAARADGGRLRNEACTAEAHRTVLVRASIADPAREIISTAVAQAVRDPFPSPVRVVLGESRS